MDRLIEAARKRGRNGARDAAAILLAYRHGLRAAELCAATRHQSICIRYGSWHSSNASLVSADGPTDWSGCKAAILGSSAHAETFNRV